ncbi:MAG: hypothetical protein MZW92_39815 [Comamonadaceae bacterium]|nr:hypothetical protein [Comamonadaceae bacterium]
MVTLLASYGVGPIDVSAPLADGRFGTAIAIGSGTTGATCLQPLIDDAAMARPPARSICAWFTARRRCRQSTSLSRLPMTCAGPRRRPSPALRLRSASTAAAQPQPCRSAATARVRASADRPTSRSTPARFNWALDDAVVVAVLMRGPSNSPIQPSLLAPKGSAAAFVRRRHAPTCASPTSRPTCRRWTCS